MDLPDVDNPEEFRCISLCTGYAGIELGLKRVVPALRTVAYVEREGFACANLAAKIEAGELDAAPIWTDIKTFNGKPFCQRVHIITAGYPCQSESHAGKRKGKADPRWLWPHIERIIETVEPLWFFGENVSGHLSLGFPTVYRSLRNLGYKVEAGLFTAEEVGAPHKRERLFILAYNTDGRCEAKQIQQKRKSTFRHGCKGLADTEHPEQGQGTIKGTSTGIGRDRLTECGLADTEHAGPQGPGPGISAGVEEFAWPSRPGQPQYEWEEPRIVDNTQHRRHEPKKGQIQTGRDSVKYKGKGQAQSRLGRAANGTKSRVDRLRLLGNGVVPRQAEKAFRVLISTFGKAFFEANR